MRTWGNCDSKRPYLFDCERRLSGVRARSALGATRTSRDVRLMGQSGHWTRSLSPVAIFMGTRLSIADCLGGCAGGFFDFSHALVRPLTYREPIRFETMPSSPKPPAWRKMRSPSPVRASLSWIPSRSVRADAQGDISFDHLVGTRQKDWRDC